MSLLRLLPSIGRWVVPAIVITGLAIAVILDGSDRPASRTTEQARLATPLSSDSTSQERRVHSSAAARALRRASRSRYTHLRAAEAVSLARRVFPEQMKEPVFSARRISGGKRIVEHRGPGRALVEDKDGNKSLLVSTADLQAENEQGKLAPVDLSLERTPAGIEPANSTVPIVIDPTSAAKIKFTGLGMGMQVAGAQASNAGAKVAARSTPAVVSDDRAFFSNVLTDTDAGVLPLPNGAELFLIARSDQAPERFVLALELPPGATLRQAVSDTPVPDGVPRSIEVVKNGMPLAYISSPVAHDADGRGVPASMSVEGDDIVLDVEHRDLDIRYPLSIDPEAVAWTDHASHFAGWTSTKSHPNWFAAIDNCAVYCGLYQGIPQNTAVPNNSTAYFSFQAPAKTAITEAQLGGLAYVPYVISNVPYTRAYQGILKDSTWEPGRFTNQDGLQPNTGYAASVPTGNAFWGHTNTFNVTPTTTGTPPTITGTLARDDNKAIMAMSANHPSGGPWVGPTATHGANTMAWARFLIADKHKPTWHPDSTDPTNAWRDDNNALQSRSLRATDQGLGLYQLKLTGAAIEPFPAAEGTLAADTITAKCAGTPPQPVCPADWPTSHVRYKLNEGTNTLTAQATDLVGNTVETARTWTEKIDRTHPTVSTSGELADDDDDYINGERTYSVTVSATDASADGSSIAVAGVSHLRLERDGGVVLAEEIVACPNGECPRSPTAHLTVDGDQLTEGRHTIIGAGVDAAQHTGVGHPITIYVDRAPPAFTQDPSVEVARDADSGDAVVLWSPAPDPDLSDGSKGSATSTYEFRYRRGQAPWSAWSTTDLPRALIPGAIVGEAIDIELKPIDAVGNAGPSFYVTSTVGNGGDLCAATADGYPPDCDANSPDETFLEARGWLERDAGTIRADGTFPGLRWLVRNEGHGWQTIRTWRKSYAMGNVRDGMSFDRVFQDYDGNLGYFNGKIRGGIDHCGWIALDDESSPQQPVETDCPPVSTSRAGRPETGRFASTLNCEACGAGSELMIKRPTSVCLNVDPSPLQGKPAKCLNKIRTRITAEYLDDHPEGYRVAWRYVTRGPGRRYIMARDTVVQDRYHGVWMFIPRGAVPGALCGRSAATGGYSCFP